MLFRSLWKNEYSNPIYHYVPKGLHRASSTAQSLVSQPKPELSIETTSSPHKKIFQVSMRQEDCITAKTRLAKNDPIVDPYTTTESIQLRDLYLPATKKDFCVRIYIILVKI